MSDAILSHIASLLTGKGQRQYGLHNVTQLQHALQSAWLAEQDGAADAISLGSPTALSHW